LCRNAPLHRDVVAEHLPDRFAQRLGAVDHEQHPLLDVQTTGHQIRQQRAGDGGVLGATAPQPQRELFTLGRDPQRDDVRAALDLDPVEHHDRQPQIGELPGHQMPQRLPSAVHERPRHRALRRRPLPCRRLFTDATALAANPDLS
jgi:hypothetical protein